MPRALEFLARAAIGVAVALAICLPFREVLLALVCRAAERLLAWLWSPPLVTALQPSGHVVEIRGLLFEPGQWMGRWEAENLLAFLVAAFGLAIALPVRNLAGRLALVLGTLWMCFVAMVIVASAEAVLVATLLASSRRGIDLLSPSERAIVVGVHGSVDAVQMILPAIVALVAYGMDRMEPDARAPSRGGTSWRWPMAWLALLGATVVVLNLPVAPPDAATRIARFARTAELNPASEEAAQAYRRATRLAELRLRRERESHAEPPPTGP